MKSIIDEIGKERVAELMQAAVDEVVAKLHAAGLPSVGLIDGVVCERHADGRVVPADRGEQTSTPQDKTPTLPCKPVH